MAAAFHFSISSYSSSSFSFGSSQHVSKFDITFTLDFLFIFFKFLIKFQLFSCFSHSFCSQKTPNIKKFCSVFQLSLLLTRFSTLSSKKMSDSYLTKRFNERFWTTWGYLALGQFKPPINQGMKNKLNCAASDQQKSIEAAATVKLLFLRPRCPANIRQPSGFSQSTLCGKQSKSTTHFH